MMIPGQESPGNFHLHAALQIAAQQVLSFEAFVLQHCTHARKRGWANSNPQVWAPREASRSRPPSAAQPANAKPRTAVTLSRPAADRWERGAARNRQLQQHFSRGATLVVATEKRYPTPPVGAVSHALLTSPALLSATLAGLCTG
mmetsp:Transcript_10527/g.19406  ORF Transcript_10527/g.19406 Transcript_10527/m.19406 type:complete len:145 (-) Transcript_10527:2218-2652(-)